MKVRSSSKSGGGDKSILVGLEIVCLQTTGHRTVLVYIFKCGVKWNIKPVKVADADRYDTLSPPRQNKPVCVVYSVQKINT